MTFNINIPTASKYAVKNGTNSKGQSTVVADGKSSSAVDSSNVPRAALAGPNNSAGEASVLINTGIGLTGGLSGAASSGLGSVSAFGAAQSVSLTPKTQRITTSISLYTPESLLVQYGHEWNSISLTAALGKYGKFAAAGAGELLKELGDKGTQILNMGTEFATSGKAPTGAQVRKALKFNSAVGAELEANIAEETGIAGPNFADLVLRSQNKAINPKNEMLFQGTANRQFTFNFDFQPRSQKEAFEIYQIIRTFKAFAAPEYSNEGAGRYMIPPALFDIGFFFMNAENLALPRISTCALREIALDYNHSAPFATFNDGFPVHINMQLTFAEIDIITRELIQKYGY